MSSSPLSSSSSSSSLSSLSDYSSFSLSSSSCRQFSLDEIKEATNNFDEKKVIGFGGEGKVYLAEIYLENKTVRAQVAVKCLKKDNTDFEKEIWIIHKIKHPNLVCLLGYCRESNEKILIYEYVEKGSLSDYLKMDSIVCLSWKQRLNICLGAAYGLRHLHKKTYECRKGIIHRDVKPANILLDQNWVAKVSDFGILKLSKGVQTNSFTITDTKRGTPGYFAPEYAMSNKITTGIDVYAFGVVMFEALCQKKPWDRGDVSFYAEEDEDLGGWAKENVYSKIKADISYNSLRAFTDAIGGSLLPDPNKRLTIDNVVLSLETALKCQEHEDELTLKAQRLSISMIEQKAYEDFLDINRSTRVVPPSSFSLEIESFSKLLEILSASERENYISNTFEASGYKWKLCLYPNGHKEKDGEGHISLYLLIAETEVLPVGWDVKVNLKMFVLDQLNGTYCIFQDKNGEIRNFRESMTESGFAKLLPLSVFKDPKNGFLARDKCVFGVEVFVLNYSGQGECLTSLLKTEAIHTWKIDIFSSFQNYNHNSDEFILGNRTWSILIYPKGYEGSKGEAVSIFLELKDIEKKGEAYVDFKIRMKDQLHGKHKEYTARKGWFSMSAPSWGWTHFLALSDLYNASKGFLVKDTLIIEMEIESISSVKKFTPS